MTAVTKTGSSEQNVTTDIYPALTRTMSGEVDGILTETVFVTFADKLLFTISQDGRLSHWVHVTLDNATPDQMMMPRAYGHDENEEDPRSDLLPLSHLTATTILGGTEPEINTVGQLCATQIASALLARSPEERRLLVVGLGLQTANMDRSAYFDLVELAMKCTD